MEAVQADTKNASGCPVMGKTMELRGNETRLDPIIRNNPFPFYRALRKQEPVYYDPDLDMYHVTRYEDVMTVLRDDVSYSVQHGNRDRYANGFGDEVAAVLTRDAGGFYPDIPQDGPDHIRVRRLLEKAFTAKRVKSLEPRIQQIVVDLIEPLAERGYGDGIKDIGGPLTAQIICDQLGFDFAEVGTEKVARWSNAVLAQMGRMQTHEQMLENVKVLVELQNYIIPKIRERMANPREDLTSDLVNARIEGDENAALSFGEMVASVRALLIAGNDTTAAAIANLMMLLATQPDLAKLLYESADDDRMLSRFVEEVLRVEPPTHGLFRATTKEVQLGGKTIPPHAQICILYASANDDDAHFQSPRTLDLNRPNIGTNVTFGAGIHRCIGAALARAEIKIAAREIIKRLDNIKLAIPVEELTYQATLATQTLTRVPLTFTRRA